MTAVASAIGAVRPAPTPGAPRLFQIGRSFVNPLFDLLVIGGLLTIPIAIWVAVATPNASAFITLAFPTLALLCNQPHFAASTVRLYTKPHTFEDLPFLTFVFPLVTLAAVSVFVALAGSIGHHLQALYLTWSPYHYAAQTFGLATMYSYRSGCRLDRSEWWALRGACMLPFVHSLVAGAPMASGLGWVVPYPVLAQNATTFALLTASYRVLSVMSLAAPLAVFAFVALRSRREPQRSRPGMPLISVVLMLSNAAWWVLFSYWDALLWATVLHGLQYLGIMSVFYADDATRRPDNRHGRAYHVVALLAACLALGYALFQCWPHAYMALGFGQVESVYMVLAAINIHHFVVDRYIWRIRKDRNYQTVVA